MSADLPEGDLDEEQASPTGWLEYLFWGIPGYRTSAAVTDPEPYQNPHFH